MKMKPMLGDETEAGIPGVSFAALRFRTNDVLLGTSGVGVRFSVVSIQLFRPVNILLLIWLYRFRFHLLRPHLTVVEQRPLELSSGCQIGFGLEGGRKMV